MTLPLNLNDLLVPSDRTVVDRQFFNRRFKSIYDGLSALDARQAVYDAAEAQLVELGLERLNEAMGPMLVILQEASDLGFLTAEVVGTSISLVEGEANGFTLTSGAELFTPTPFLMMQDQTDSTNWGIVSLDEGGWTRETGELAVHIVYASKTQASTQWTISASAGMLPAMQDVLADAVAARDATEGYASTVEAAMSTLEDLIEAIQQGPVASVAGRTGVIVLAQSDITGLVDALAAKASTASLTSGLSTKQNASAKLTSLANAAWATDKYIYFSDASTVVMGTITADARTLLASANFAAMLTALGVSAFAQTLLDDTDAAAALSTLGAAAASAVPAKASSAEVLAGTDDAKFATAAGIAAAYGKKALEFSAPQGASFTLTAAFAGQTVPWTKSSAGTITLSNAAPAGTVALIDCEGAGQITFSAQAGGSVQSRGARYKSNGQYSQITAWVYSNSGTNAAWRLAGDLTV